MLVQFNTNNKLPLPSYIVYKKIYNYNLIIAPLLPNWIVLSKKEMLFFDLLKSQSINDALLDFQNKFHANDILTLKIASAVLKKIEQSGFYENKKKNQDNFNTITKNIHINLTNSCNLRCKHCFVSAGFNKTEALNLLELKNIIHSLSKYLGETDIVFSGGEPLFYKDIFELLNYTKSLGHKVILFTNGLLINKSNIKLIKKYVDEVQISMEGISKDAFEYIRGKNTYSKLVRCLNLIKNNNINLCIALTIIDSQLTDVENNLIHFLNKLQYSKLNIRINDELERKGNAIRLDSTNFKKTLLKKKRIKVLVDDLRDHNYLLNKKSRNIGFSNCGIGSSIVINFDGHIYPCNETFGSFGNIFSDVQAILNDFDKLNADTEIYNIPKCMDCDLLFICSGGCKLKNLEKNGSYFKPICDDVYKRNIYYELILDSL